jgi:hypothetical protein
MQAADSSAHMSTTSVRRELLLDVAELRLPRAIDLRLRRLMDRNTNGELDSEERDELAALVELSERLSIASAVARHL